MGIARAQCNEAREEGAPEVKQNEVARSKKKREPHSLCARNEVQELWLRALRCSWRRFAIVGHKGPAEIKPCFSKAAAALFVVRVQCADCGFFVERAALCIVTSRSFCVEMPH